MQAKQKWVTRGHKLQLESVQNNYLWLKKKAASFPWSEWFDLDPGNWDQIRKLTSILIKRYFLKGLWAQCTLHCTRSCRGWVPFSFVFLPFKVTWPSLSVFLSCCCLRCSPKVMTKQWPKISLEWLHCWGWLFCMYWPNSNLVTVYRCENKSLCTQWIIHFHNSI